MTATSEDSGRIEHLAMPIPELGCAGAAPSIERALRSVPGVSRVYANAVTEMAYIEYEADHCDEGMLRAALSRAGYGEQPPELPRASSRSLRGPKAGLAWLLTGVARAVRFARHRAPRRAAEPRRSP